MRDATLIVRRLERLADTLARHAPRVQRRLYLRFSPDLPDADAYLAAVPKVYAVAAQQCPALDVRLLLGVPHKTADVAFEEDGNTETDLLPPNSLAKKYDNVVLGGTFDRLHYGHKVLLSSAVLLANKRITCGVTAGEMNRSELLYNCFIGILAKKLWELISPVEERIAWVREFVDDVSAGVEVNAVPILDPFGPSIVEEDLQCIVVSKETVRGGEAVNKRRLEKGMTKLDTFVIELLDGEDVLLKETKLSSSARRRAMLGTLLRPPSVPKHDFPTGKYIVGLTGGICSGKTHISNFLKTKGCNVSFPSVARGSV